MKNQIQFTGVNIAAALLIVTYFMPWVGGIASASGFNLFSLGVSPGIFTYVLGGLSRLIFVLLVLVPVSGGIILYQNVTGKMNFSKYYKAAHYLPAILLLVTVIGAYFKMRSTVKDAMEQAGNSFGFNMSQYMPKIETPGLFDVMSAGAYISLIAALYIMLVSIGKIKDKVYFKNSSETAENTLKG